MVYIQLQNSERMCPIPFFLFCTLKNMHSVKVSFLFLSALADCAIPFSYVACKVTDIKSQVAGNNKITKKYNNFTSCVKLN